MSLNAFALRNPDHRVLIAGTPQGPSKTSEAKNTVLGAVARDLRRQLRGSNVVVRGDQVHVLARSSEWRPVVEATADRWGLNWRSKRTKSGWRIRMAPCAELDVEVGAAPDPLAGTREIDGIPGVYAKPGVVLTAATRAFLLELRRIVPSSVPLVVTSGKRTETAQASALKTKRTESLRKYGDEGKDLRGLYRRGKGPEIVESILAVPNEVAAMAEVLRRWVAQGVYMSRHMRGDAVDFRVRGLSEAQIKTIMRGSEALGTNVVREKTPAHIHVGRVCGMKSGVQPLSGGGGGGGGGVILAAGLGLALLGAGVAIARAA